MRLVQVDGQGEYQPIAGSFREDLESYAKNREFVTIEFFDGKADRKMVGVRISGITDSSNGSYIQVVQSGTEFLIRLDTLKAVNERPFVARSEEE